MIPFISFLAIIGIGCFLASTLADSSRIDNSIKVEEEDETDTSHPFKIWKEPGDVDIS